MLFCRQAGGDSGPEAHIWIDGHGHLVPDVCYWAPGRAVLDAPERQLPPTLTIELSSTGQSLASQREKCRFMRANGVDVCWLIDPNRRRVETFEGGRDAERFDGEILETDAVPGLRVDLRELFALLDD